MHLLGGRDDMVGVELDEPMASHTKRTLPLLVDVDGGPRTLRVFVLRSKEDAPILLEAPVVIVDPAYEADKAACLAKGD